jgi:hypothetical protein
MNAEEILETDHRAIMVAQRLKAYYTGAVNEAHQLRRANLRYVNAMKKGIKLQKTNLSEGDVLRSEAYFQKQRSRQSQILRAIHLLKMFLKGKEYKKVEESTKKTTLEPQKLLERYFLRQHKGHYWFSMATTGDNQPMFVIPIKEIQLWFGKEEEGEKNV